MKYKITIGVFRIITNREGKCSIMSSYKSKINNMVYKHTQIGYLIIITLIIPLLILFFTMLFTEFTQILLVVFFALLLVLALFYSLTVEIDKTKLTIKFGFGIISKQFNLRDIKFSRTVKNRWYYGWGIRAWFCPCMLIYNVSGFDAVEIKMKNGKTYRIGTDEPKDLEYAITKAIK